MEIKVSHRYAKVSPRKARLVIDLIRGVAVDDAFATLHLTRRRASAMITKLLRSAVAGAAERHDVEADELYVAKAWIDGGPMLKRWWCRPRGVAARKVHRSSHINLVVATREDAEKAEKAEKAASE